MSVAACHEWFAQAHNRFTLGYRSVLPNDVEAQLDDQHTVASRVFQLPTWRGSFKTPMDQLEKDLADHWDRTGKPFIDGFAYNVQKAAILPVVVVLGLFLLLVNANVGFAFIVAAVVGGVWAFIIYNRFQNALKAQEQARQKIADAKAASLAELRGAGAELTDWTTRYRKADAVEASTRHLIASLPTFGHGRTDFDGRVVD